MRLATKVTVYVIAGASAALSLRIAYNRILEPLLFGYLTAHTNKIRDVVETPSPDGRTIVASFHIFGGATTQDMTMVVIRPRGESFDPDHNFCLLSMDGLEKTKTVWNDSGHVTINYENKSYPYARVPAWNGIIVTFSDM